MDTNEFLRKHKVLEHYAGYTFRRLAPRMLLADGVTLSVQVSQTHYCDPREDDAYLYTDAEIGYPSQDMGPEFTEYAEDAENPTQTVYGYVPIYLIDRYIIAHGGIVGTETFVNGEDGKGVSVQTKFSDRAAQS